MSPGQKKGIGFRPNQPLYQKMGLGGLGNGSPQNKRINKQTYFL